jgi:hypothetical protein
MWLSYYCNSAAVTVDGDTYLLMARTSHSWVEGEGLFSVENRVTCIRKTFAGVSFSKGIAGVRGLPGSTLGAFCGNSQINDPGCLLLMKNADMP